jgi:DNA-nicking Smr family endonuclease
VKQEDDESEAALFAAAMRGVKPLRVRAERAVPEAAAGPGRRPRVRPRRAPTAPAAPASDAPWLPALPTVGGEETFSFRRHGVQEGVVRRLRRGAIPSEGEIDLHGLTGAQAAAALAGFLVRAAGRGLRCVRVVHGKGLRSGTRGPVLKSTTFAVLREHPAVNAFVSARREDGGTGATYVLLSSAAASKSPI